MDIKKHSSKRIGNITIEREQNQITIHSERLELRSLNQDNEDFLMEHYSILLSDKKNVELFGEGLPWEPAQVNKFVQEEINKWNAGEQFCAFAIYDLQTKVFMGSLHIHYCADDFAAFGKEYEHVAEIAYIFDKAFWGKGYGTEVAILGKKYIKQIIDEAPKDSPQSSIKKIVATSHPDNEGSKKILLKTLKHHEPQTFTKFNGQPRQLFFKCLELKKASSGIDAYLSSVDVKLQK